MLKVEKLSAYYESISALKGVSIEVPKGQIVSIIGANGAGKSTLLRAISGLVKNKEGSILYKNMSIDRLSADRIVALGISHVPEGRQIFVHLTVQDNLTLGAYLYFKRSSRQDIHGRFETVFDLFPILKRRVRQIAGTLSGGEQQMLSIGRALMGRPDLLLLDEPSMGLAPLIVREIFSVIKHLNRQGTTVLLIEQNAIAALHIAHYAYVLATGEIVLQGPAGDLLNNPNVKTAYLGV